MLNILSSSATSASSDFAEQTRAARETNLQWFARNLPGGDGLLLVLLGGRDPVSLRVRMAQAELRDDLSPSNWSHIGMLEWNSSAPGQSIVTEISLVPRTGFGFPPPVNAVQTDTLAVYRAARSWPNIAVMRLPVKPDDAADALRRFQRQRVALDATELLVAWLAFVWGAGSARNPLLEGVGLPSAALIESVVAATGFDLTPGLENRASCPEAVWQAARWWHEYYAERDDAGPHGSWTVNHRIE